MQQSNRAAVLAVAGMVLAQLLTPGAPNLGIPAVPGTRVPESNPATAVTPPPSYTPGSSGAAPSGSAAPPPAPSEPAAPSGPAYSFGAAPPPMTSPGR